jgi:hypothetical protein
MLETLFLATLIFLFLNRKKKPRGLDAELRELIESSNDATGIGMDIKSYLLRVLQDDKNDVERFSDAQLSEAQRIIERAGPAAFYWMTEIAVQMTFLATAQANGIPTNVSEELKDDVTPERIIQLVVKP